MLQLMREGGFPMVFVLVLGLVTLVAAVRFATAPDPRRVGAVAALSVSTLAVSLVGLAAALAAVGHHLAQNDAAAEPLLRMVLQGLAEAMSPLILGGSVLTATWIVMAVGYRRLVARLPST